MSLTNPKGASGKGAKEAVDSAPHTQGAPTTPAPLSIGSHTRPSPGPFAAPPPRADGSGTGATGGNFKGQTPPSGPYETPAGGRNPDDAPLDDVGEPGETPGGVE